MPENVLLAIFTVPESLKMAPPAPSPPPLFVAVFPEKVLPLIFKVP